MKKLSNTKKPLLYLISIYCAVVLCRFLLALLTSAYPIVNIDEFLYYGMARSIAQGQGLMFRGQPANYSYIIYSLVLSPVYLLGFHGPLLYRMMQLWNILLNSLSVFPLYYIAGKAVNDEKRSLRIAAICMVLPDFMLGQVMMCENIILPLFFSLFALILCYLEHNKFKHIIGIGIIGGLLFSAKPGSVIPAAVFDLVLLFLGIKNKNKKQILHTFLSLLLTAVVAAGFFGIVSLLNGQASILSIYQAQIADGKHLNVFFKFLGIYALYIILAGGIGCFAVAFRNWKSYSANQKVLFCTVITSLIVTIIGVCWSVNRYEYNANTAHLRYIGMYLPLIYSFAIIPQHTEVKPRRNLPAEKKGFAPQIVLIITALLLVIGIYGGVNRYSVFAENMTFSVIIQLFRHQVSIWIVSAVFVILIAFWFWILKQKEKTISLCVTIALLSCMLINNLAAYTLEKKDTRFDFAEQTNKLLQLIDEDADPIYLYSVETNTSYYGAMDAYSRKSISFVKLNDMFNQLYATQGVYQPFVPEGQRGNIATLPTPQTDILFMDATVYYMLKLAEDNTSHFTENREALHLVKITDTSKPWLDAIVGNTTNTILSAGDTGILLIFNDRYLQSPCTMKFTIKCDQPTNLKFFSNYEAKMIPLEAGMHEYEFTFDKPANAYNFEAETGDIRLYGFDLTD